MKHTTLIYFPALLLLLFSCLSLPAQKISYSQPDKEEPRQTNFEILGRYDNNYLIYKNFRNNSYISVYDADMELKENIPLTDFPEKDRIIETDVIAMPDYSYLFYQFQHRSVVYIMAVKIGADGKPLSKPIELDTTQVNFFNNTNRIYSVLHSEDKKHFMVFKVNTKEEKRYMFKTLLFKDDMTLQHVSTLALSMNDRNDFLTDFYLDNDGHLVFGRGIRPGLSENINRFYLVVKPAKADSFAFNELKLDNISLDEVKLRMDNYNSRYLFTGFYYKGRRASNIEGICNAIFDKNSHQWSIKNVVPFTQDLREDARGDNSVRNAFDDYYIKQIYIKNDGGFMVIAESIYQTSRGGGGYNRWNYLYSPYSPGFDYYRYGMYSPYGYNRWGSSVVRYHADNILISAFDKDGRLELSNTIRKSQYDDDNDAMVSYQVANTGDALRFIYNDYEKRDIVLTYQSIDANGQVTRTPTMKNLDKGYMFVPRLGKQVSSKVVIMPALYRNYLCFAKLEFSATYP